MSLSLLPTMIDESNSLRFEYQLEDQPDQIVFEIRVDGVYEYKKGVLTKVDMNRTTELFHVWLEWVYQTNKARNKEQIEEV